ncbi:MAG: hypothetical protein J6V49_02875 [Bacteroidales bacterium]|nr:hypothetical protein [Bacteroidales bacterium]MBP5709896.1 hypothetical protein [Bacteroidales bacterium]
MAWIARRTQANPSFTQAEMENNVIIIASYFRGLGWTDNAIAAMCGNMQVESFLNPAQFEMGKNFSPAYGFGLVQWTPRTKFSDWAGADWETDYDLQLQRIKYELENDLQWTYNVNMNFPDFSTSTDSVSYLTEVFERNYENPLDWQASITQRVNNAESWYVFLGNTPTPKIPVWLLFKIRWNNKGGMI